MATSGPKFVNSYKYTGSTPIYDINSGNYEIKISRNFLFNLITINPKYSVCHNVLQFWCFWKSVWNNKFVIYALIISFYQNCLQKGQFLFYYYLFKYHYTKWQKDFHIKFYLLEILKKIEFQSERKEAKNISTAIIRKIQRCESSSMLIAGDKSNQFCKSAT